MLDMGFSAQLSRIMEEVPSKRQTLLFSATISPQITQLA
jgi:superfamily II DNA/RNA helicase